MGKYCSKQIKIQKMQAHGVAKLSSFPYWRGADQPPEACHFGTQTTLSWREWRRCGFMRNFHLSLKQPKFGALPIIRVIARNNFLWPVDSTGQTSNYQTSALTILWMTCLPPKPRAPSLILPQKPHTPHFHSFWTPHVLGSLTFSSMWSPHMHECN